MTIITSDQFRDISIKTVEGFLNDKVSLSEGLAKFASHYEMNSEQVQRAVEATNSIAYLKVLSMADDRTVEFPLCKYAEVMAELTLPAGILEKAAAATTEPKGTETIMEKVASAPAFEATPLKDVEKQVMFIKLAAQNKRDLQALKEQSMFMGPDLLKAASDLKKDPQALEKLASVVTGVEFQKLSTLVFGTAQTYADTGLFKTAELKEATGLAGMLKQAEALVADIKHKEGLDKEAFLGATASLFGRAVGTLASAPVKVVGKAIGRSAHNLGQSAKSVGVAAGNKVRTAVGKAPMPMPVVNKKRFGLGAGLAVAAGVGFDASMYSPGTDKTTGRSKNVWNTLQQEPK